MSRRLWSYLQRDRERERDAAVQERRALYAQNAAHAPGTHEPTSAEGTLGRGRGHADARAEEEAH